MEHPPSSRPEGVPQRRDRGRGRRPGRPAWPPRTQKTAVPILSAETGPLRVPESDDLPRRWGLGHPKPGQIRGQRPPSSSLHRGARLATGSEHADGLAYPWHRRPPTTLAALRAALADRYAVATANASVNAIRGALRAAWLSGDMDRAMLERSLAALRQVRGKAAPGRALSPVEVRKLFEAAAGDRNHAAGARDAALLALAYGAGLRRAELAAARLADLDGDTLGVHGKGRRERIAYLGANGCAAAVSAWIAVRGTEDGPLFRPVNKGGRVIAGGMSPRAIGKRVQVLGARAGLGKVSPHMLRRSFATSLLSAGNDLSVTADLMGHARTDTTRLYDRRGESAKRAAASTISVPYVRPGAQRTSELELGDPPGAVE